MLKLKNITATIKELEVLKNINLEINSGEIHALIGPKQSGKSSLVHTILGNPILDVEKGSIQFKNKSIIKKSPDERSLLGIFTSFQFLPVLDGISNFQLTKEILKARNDTRTAVELEKEYKALVNQLGLSSNHGNKWVNDESVTITECKKNEILQLLLLNPTLIVLDEIDAGVDEEEIELIALHIKKFVASNDKAVLVVTHNTKFLDMLNPTHVNIMYQGSIKAQGSTELYKRIVNDDYSQFS